MRYSRCFTAMVLLVATANLAGADDARIDFARDIQPLLAKSCGKCHGADKQQGGLRFDLKEGALRAGESGSQAIVPGKSGESELIRRVESADASERMPLEAEPLPAEQIKLLRAWIAQGAQWPDSGAGVAAGRSEMVVTDEDRRHWSYRPLHVVDPPPVKDEAWCKTPIDRFIRAAQEAKGIGPNPPASRRALIRRVYYDLIGLPPSPEEVEAFVADPSPRAYEEMVDRLLATRHYGERWGRHWLDLARYADSSGMETDEDRPNAYHFRDFVIRALNDDLSYQTFVRWQLAGDEYEPDNPLALAATGFLTGAPNEKLTDQHLEEERLRLRFNELDDMAVTTVSAMLGLTLGCARCHDHKFDAIPTRDYYRIQCALTTTSRGDVLLASRAEAAKFREEEAKWNQRIKEVKDKLGGWLAEVKKPHQGALRTAKIDALPIGDDEKKLLKEQPEADAAKKLAKKHEKALAISDEDFRRILSDEQRQKWDALKQEVETVERQRPQPPPSALAITDTKAEPQPTWLLERGDFYARKEKLALGFLSVLTSGKSPEEYFAIARRDGPPGRSTLQRRALADWIGDAEHGAGALLARVMVNRVWQHHFGEGLARTVSDLGVRGERPTHPELLEWLAHDFVQGDWRLKRLHRLILTSAVYQQDTAFDDARSQVDPDNRLLWRRRPQRLEAEILRDAVLAVSGTLNLEPFGPAFKPPIPSEAIVARNTKNPYPQDAQDSPATRRRTVYMFHKRVTQHPLMQVFDGPDASVSCGRRSTTTVAPQALALLNDALLRQRSVDFARRLMTESDQPQQWAERGFYLALSRPPSEAERAAAVQFVEQQQQRRAARDKSAAAEEVKLQALADFCQTLFGLNEFVYVD